MTLQKKIKRRVRVHRIAAAMFACGAAGMIGGLAGDLYPWWAGLGAIPFMYLATVNIMAAGHLIQIMRSPVFSLLAIMHDLTGEDLS